MSSLPEFVRPGDVIVFNNTKVLPAELKGIREPRADGRPVSVSLTLSEPLAHGAWKALARPARRLRTGDLIIVDPGGKRSLLVVLAKGADGEVVLGAEGADTVAAIMERHGSMPIPPYISRLRPTDERDVIDYQTVYAKQAGAVAAPTAGLHFTTELLARLSTKGVATVFVTLHVGPGTFLPVKEETIHNPALHAEWCEISPEAAHSINGCRAQGGRLIAVGTTTLRLLETAASDDGTIRPYRGETSLFIKPGYKFKSAELLLTNFHLPKSTLFMLVCAFSGTAVMQNAYRHAVGVGYRFYSYGDACLLHRTAE